MRIRSFRLVGIRCFRDTGEIELNSGCNIFVGQNNAGKSTLLRSIISWQVNPFHPHDDIRPGLDVMWHELTLEQVGSGDYVRSKPAQSEVLRYTRTWRAKLPQREDIPTQPIKDNEAIFGVEWPKNFIIPFVAKRKAAGYDQNVSRGSQVTVDGTYRNLYARIDRVASPGTQAHEFYRRAVEKILGVFIGTQSAPGGKQAGYQYDEDTFVPLDQMGDGVAEIVALIVDLSLAVGKVFVLEEPETNLHPRGLKALLELIRESSKRNQFIIATHSNIVVRELGSEPQMKVFRVFRDGDEPSSPSSVVVT